MSRPIITSITVQPLHLQLKNPFITARGSKTISQNLKVSVRLSDGSNGSGEACSSLAWPENSPAAMRECIRRIEKNILETSPSDALQIVQDHRSKPWARAAALAGLESALLTADAHSQNLPLWKLFAQKLKVQTQRPIPLQTSLTISPWPLPQVQQAAEQAHQQKFSILKLKVTGSDPQEDLTRLLTIHRAAPKARLIVDANQAFTRQEAHAFSRAMQLLRLPVILFEQPVAYQDLESMAWLVKNSEIPIVADESLRSINDARNILKKRAAQVLNIKISKCGVQGSLEIIPLAQREKVELMLGCMSESAEGLGPSVHLASGTGAFRYIDLDSHLLVKGPTRTPTFTTTGPRLQVCSSRF